MTGTVLQSRGGEYTVRLDGGDIVGASARGRLKRRDDPMRRLVPGDRVHLAEPEEGTYRIEHPEERKSVLTRSGPGARAPKVIAANLDRVCVVVSALRPPATSVLIDRMLALVVASRLSPHLVVNKVDLEGAGAVADGLGGLYSAIGVPVLAVSADSGQGIQELAELLCEGASALVGPSGVGKSSLLSRVQPGLDLRVGDVGERSGRGRHTTVSARLIPLACGGAVVDTPGFSDATLWKVARADLAHCFPEFEEPARACRFRGCSHSHEPDCGVREAVATGVVPETRHESYLGLLEEAE